MEKKQTNSFSKFSLKISNPPGMQGSYGAGVRTLTFELAKLFDLPDIKFLTDIYSCLRYVFVADFLFFMKNKTTCFHYLKFTDILTSVYRKHELQITFNSLAGCFVTSAYQKAKSIQVYRTRPVPNQHKPPLHTIYAPNSGLKVQ